jgi:hypothetical protein
MLLAIHREFESQPYGSIIMTDPLLARMDPSRADDDRWGAAIDRLDRHRYIEAGRAMWGRPYPIHITRLTERGLRTVGAWPGDRHPIEVLVQVLNIQAQEAEAKAEPERAGKLRKAAEVLGSVVSDVASDVISKTIRGALMPGT